MAASVVKVPAIPTSARLESSAENAAAMGVSALSMAATMAAHFRGAHRIRMQDKRSVKRTEPTSMLSGASDTALVAANKLRAAAADIDDQEFTAEQRQTALHREKGIRRFFSAGNHADVDAKSYHASVPALRRYSRRRAARWCRRR